MSNIVENIYLSVLFICFWYIYCARQFVSLTFPSVLFLFPFLFVYLIVKHTSEIDIHIAINIFINKGCCCACALSISIYHQIKISLIRSLGLYAYILFVNVSLNTMLCKINKILVHSLWYHLNLYLNLSPTLYLCLPLPNLHITILSIHDIFHFFIIILQTLFLLCFSSSFFTSYSIVLYIVPSNI